MPKAPKPRQPCTAICDVNNPDKFPFQAGVTISIDTGMPIVNGIVAIPTGKRLVLEFISGQVFVPRGQKVLFSVFCRAQDDGVFHYLDSVPVGAFGNQDCFECGQLVRLYADPGTGVALRVERNPSAGSGSGHMSLSGHFINLP
jgi:hypothetical protein